MKLADLRDGFIRLAIIVVCSILTVIMAIFITIDKKNKSKEENVITTTTAEKETILTTEPTSTAKVEDETNETVKSYEEVYYCDWIDYTFSEEDYMWLCRTTFCEAGNQDLNTQVMVALTILNRFADGRGKNIKEVIYQPNAYSVTNWEDFENYGWTERVDKAVSIALKENCHPEDMYYFRTEYYHNNFGCDYKKSGDLYFSTES